MKPSLGNSGEKCCEACGWVASDCSCKKDKPREWLLTVGNKYLPPNAFADARNQNQGEIGTFRVIEYAAYERSQAELAEANRPMVERLKAMKAKFIERDARKASDFQVIDALLNEFDAIAERDEAKAQLTVITERAGRLVGALDDIYEIRISKAEPGLDDIGDKLRNIARQALVKWEAGG